MALSGWTWLRIACVLLVLAALGAAWTWTDLRKLVSPERIAEVFGPYRSSWHGLPLVILVFVVAQLLMVPVLALVFACGLAFGPLLGPIYALLGALAGALPPFLLGRWLGRRRLERWGGALAKALTRKLGGRGLLAVFLVRKIPAPYTLVNMLCGACDIRLRDFVLGTLLGMATGVVLLTVVGSQMGEILADPSPARLGIAAGLLVGTLGLALLLQRALGRRLEQGS